MDITTWIQSIDVATWVSSVDATTWIQSIQTIVLTITLIILILQAKQLIRQTDSLIKNLEINSIEMATDKMYKIYEILIDKPKLSSVMGRNFTSETAYVALLIDLYAMIYEQYRRGLINEIDWNGWQNAMRTNFKSEIFKNEWDIVKSTLPAYFVDEMEKYIEYERNQT